MLRLLLLVACVAHAWVPGHAPHTAAPRTILSATSKPADDAPSSPDSPKVKAKAAGAGDAPKASAKAAGAKDAAPKADKPAAPVAKAAPKAPTGPWDAAKADSFATSSLSADEIDAEAALRGVTGQTSRIDAEIARIAKGSVGAAESARISALAKGEDAHASAAPSAAENAEVLVQSEALVAQRGAALAAAMSAPVLHKCLAGGAELDETRAALDGFARKLGELPSGASRAASRPGAVTVLFEGGGGLEMKLAESAAPQAAFSLPWLELTVSRTAYAPGSYVRAKDEAVVLKKLERMLGA